MIIIIKQIVSASFIYMNPNRPMYVSHTWNEHLGFFHCLILCLKLRRELLFFIFAGSCCHNCGPLYAKISSPQYTVFGKQLSRSLGFLIVCRMFLSLNKSFIIGGDISFRHLKISIISCWIFLTWMFTKSCLLKS